MRSRVRDIRDGLIEGDARERGVVLAFLAMILFTLIVMAGLAVDVGNWWWTGQKVQKAADAAAMAGVTYMPEDLSASGSQAKAMAQTIASRNGYVNGTNANVVVAGVVDDAGAAAGRSGAAVDRAGATSTKHAATTARPALQQAWWRAWTAGFPGRPARPRRVLRSRAPSTARAGSAAGGPPARGHRHPTPCG